MTFVKHGKWCASCGTPMTGYGAYCPDCYRRITADIRRRQALPPGCRYQIPLTGATNEIASIYEDPTFNYEPYRGPYPQGRPDPAAHTDPGPSWDDAVRILEDC